jgi:hypothetical protein
MTPATRNPWIGSLSLVIAGALAWGCGAAAEPRSASSASPIATSPRELAIGISDLPKVPGGWTVDTEATRTITDSKQLLGAGSDDSPYQRNGWTGAYEAGFISGGDGLVQVRVLIQQFRGPEGARAFFAEGIGSQKGLHGQPLTSPPNLGNDSNLFVQQVTGKELTQYWFYWVDRNVMVRIVVSAPDGRISESEADATAERQEALIARQ